MSEQASIFQRLQDWLAGNLGQAYGLTEVSAEAGQASLRCRPAAEHFNPLGTVHGGYTATLFDAALGLAVYSIAEADAIYVTAGLEIAYRQSLTADCLPLHTEAHVMGREGRQVFVKATLRDCHGHLCAEASARFVSPRA